jgi:small-conductance mechanosensitive channel
MWNPFHPHRQRVLESMFETRSEAWSAAGLEREISVEQAQSAGRRIALTVPALVATFVLRALWLDHIQHRPHLHLLLGQTTTRIVAVILVAWLGWMISRDVSRLAPVLFKRMDPATAGTVGFILRLLCVAATVLATLAVAGITTRTLAVGGAFTAVVLGLAAQQTLGNLFAGMVLLSARPFKLGELVHLQAGALGGPIKGVVSQLGLLYTTVARGEDRVQIPNTLVLSAVVVPVREPEPVDVRVRLAAGLMPSHLQAVLDSEVSTPTLNPPTVVLEEIDGGEPIVRVQATPEDADDGVKLADQIITVLTGMTGQHSVSTRADVGS